MNKGKLIVFEGADGSGKSTQAKLLFEYLNSKKIPAVLTSFPRYESAWGKMVRRYLNGEFGNVNQVDPYLASVIYASDRLLASVEIKKWLSAGKIVVCDRYAASNVAHQSAKISNKKEKEKFISWLENLEFVENKIPEPDLVILLTIPANVAQKFMAARKKDIHEKDVEYQTRVSAAFHDYGKSKKNWVEVSNVEGSELRSLDEVNHEIVGILKKKKYIR